MIEAPIVFDHVAAVRGRTVTRGALRRRAALSVLGGVVWAVLAVLVVALIVVRGSWWMVLLVLVFALLAALTLAGGVLRLRQIPTGESEDPIDLLGPHARHVLSRLTFFVLSPFLLFVVLAQADVHTLFSALLPVSAIAAVAVFIVYAVVASASPGAVPDPAVVAAIEDLLRTDG